MKRRVMMAERQVAAEGMENRIWRPSASFRARGNPKWLLGTVLALLAACLYAQLPAPLPGDYGFIFSDPEMWYNNHMLDITDLHYLGVSRETGEDEFLAVFVNLNYPSGTRFEDPNDPVHRDPRYAPIHIVYFSYGGLPLRLTIRNVLTFRPRVSGSLTPSYPLRAQLVYQPPRIWSGGIIPAKWYLFAHSSFLIILPDRFYTMSPQVLAGQIQAKYFAYTDSADHPVFGAWAFVQQPAILPLSVVRRDRYISSILVWGQGNLFYTRPRFVALDGDGNLIGAWELSAFIEDEVVPARPICGVSAGEIPLGVFGGGGGSANVGPIAALPPVDGAPDEYAILFTNIRLNESRPIGNPVLVRFRLDGRVRWARMYRLLNRDGSYSDPQYAGAFFVAVDDSNSSGLRLLTAWGYQTPFLTYVDATNGNPLWASTGPFGPSDTYARVPVGGQWLWRIGDPGLLYSIDDSGITPIKCQAVCYPMFSPDCWDVGDRAFLFATMGSYIVFGDDTNVAIGGNCQNGYVYLPALGFWPWDRQTMLDMPNRRCNISFEPRIVCTDNPGHLPSFTVYATPVGDRIAERPATVEVGTLDYPVRVGCKIDPCSDSVCPNGVGWRDGDVAPYNIDTPPYLLGNCCVDDDDLLQVLFYFGTTYDYSSQFKPGAGDVDCNGEVNDDDLLIVLFNFGLGCSP